MKRSILPISLLLLPLSSFAESGFTAELLAGLSSHTVNVSNNVEGSENDTYRSKLSDKALAIRFAYKYNRHLSFELAMHDHGEAINKFELSIPSSPILTPSGSLVFVDNSIATAKIPIELNSIRLGVKGQWHMDSFSLNARLGLAKWEFGDFSPKNLSLSGYPVNQNINGTDLYFGIGLEYTITENFFIGLEYSSLSIDEKQNDNFFNAVQFDTQYDVKDLSLVLGWAF